MGYFLLLFSLFFLSDPGSVKHIPSANLPLKQIDKRSTTSNTRGTTFIFVRHAEKQRDGKDPELSEDGKTRAEELAFCLSKLTIASIYSTPYKRTMQTVKPLADQLKISVTEYAATMPYDELIQQISEAHPGKIVVIAGHSNTIPEILKVLSNNSYSASIPESEYDNLFIVTTNGKETRDVLNLKYGKTSNGS